MKDLLKQTDDELALTLRWDRFYGPKLQALEKRRTKIGRKEILDAARRELRQLTRR